MGGGGDDIRNRDRRGVQSCGHKTCNVGHVNHESGVRCMGNFGKAIKIDDSRIGTCASNDHFWTVLFCKCCYLIIINGSGFLRDTIVDKLIEFPRKIYGASMGQVAAVGKVHSENRITRVYYGHEGGHVGLGAGVGLDIDIIGVK